MYSDLQPIIGHEKIENELARSIISGKVFPTWVFSGPFGVGKAGIAKKFAKCLLSGFKPQLNNLNLSPSPLYIPEDDPIHRLVDLRTHPDLFILEQTEESISINATRELMQKIRKKPTMSEWRVVIIENASNLNKNIYNSMLKILEEPPKNTVIIMICQNTGNIPKTLLSRASKVVFNPLKDHQVETVLRKMQVIPESEVTKIAAISNGSVGYALYLSKHNGLEIFEKLEKAFYENDKKSIQYLIDSNLANNFRIIKESLFKIFQTYIREISGINNNKSSNTEENTFRIPKNIDAEKEIKKIFEIIAIINRTESLMLDKTVVLAYAFEKFFDV